MTLTKEQMREYMRKRRRDPEFLATERRARQVKRTLTDPTKDRIARAGNRPFVGVDGEGGYLHGKRRTEQQDYILLRAGSSVLHTGNPLSATECLSFLSDLPSDVIHVSYYFDYDVTMMLKELPFQKLWKLLHPEKRQGKYGSFPVDWEGFRLDYLPRKMFKVKREGQQSWVTINDVGTFFQCAFLKMLEDWQVASPEEWATIQEGKEQRQSFRELTAEMIRYNGLECDLLERSMEQFRDVCRTAGYVPTRWQGPGSLAVTMLQTHRVPLRKDLELPEGLIQAANDSYYGGRFEATVKGRVSGPVYQYDINSAYPHAMTTLPCLVHGRWSQRRQPTSNLFLADVSFKPIGATPRLYHFPIRLETGLIMWPSAGRGWYWSPEIMNAHIFDHQTVEYHHVWQYEKECSCTPFQFIPAVYAERLKLGKSGVGKILKLGLNSLYGKQCQSVGSAPYANPVYASLITSHTRGKLDLLSHSGPDCCSDVLMLATDGLFCHSPRSITVGKTLGGWDLEEHTSLFVIQPGLYFTSDSDMPKTRGLPRRIIVENRQAFYDNPTLSPVDVTVTQFIGLKLALARGNPKSAGKWVEQNKRVSFNSLKRSATTEAINGVDYSLPIQSPPQLKTVPYSKDIGRMLEEMRYLDDPATDQPDWADSMEIDNE